MKKLIYTVVTNNYDTPHPIKPIEGYKCIIFTDNKNIKVDGWQTKYVKPKEDYSLFSRELKINIHKLYKSDVYVYMDANYEVIGNISKYIDKYFKGGYLAQIHPSRYCVFDEADKVIQRNIVDKELIRLQMKTYYENGFGRKKGLFANGFFVRDNSVNDMCEEWFAEVEKYTHRDQLSLPYVAVKHKDKIKVVDYKNNVLKLHPHKPYLEDVETPNIYYFQPMRGDKKFGEWLNKHCELVPNDNDWICITDQDTCFVYPFASKQIEDTIKRHGEKYQLYSCVTNRLGLQHQLPYGLSKDPNMLNHYRIAEKHYNELYSEILESKQPTAGLFMLFQKKTWLKNKFNNGLANGTRFIDFDFSSGVLKQGGKIGIMKGLYLFHYYRMHQVNPKTYDHLK